VENWGTKGQSSLSSSEVLQRVEMGQNWAITIGINGYRNLQSLNYAKLDAEAMQVFFRQELNIQTVYHFADDSLPIKQDYGSDLDSHPTYTTLKRFFRVRFEESFLQPGDNLWFFFAGHGKRYKDRDYLMPIDADPGDVESSCISLHYVSERLRRSGADNVIMLIDACRSGTGQRDGMGFGQEKQQGVITLLSCSPGESSYEIDELKHGSFTYALLEGLKIEGESNCATVERLYQHLMQRVPSLTRQYKKVKQTPYCIIEPPTKYHLILLPRKANLTDIVPLENDALRAQVQQNFELAKQLWIRILAVSPTNSKAIEGIERLARTESTGYNSNKTNIEYQVETFFAVRHNSFKALTAQISEDSLSTHLRDYKIKHIEFDQSFFFTGSICDPISALKENDKLINDFLTLFKSNQKAVIGYYGIVHIPLQFCVGYAVSTWPKVILFELDRNINCWYELATNESPKLDLSVSTISHPANAVAIVIRIAISFDISKNDVDDVVPQPYEDIQIQIGKRRIDAITHYDQVNEVCKAFREVLDDLHTRVDKSLIVHVFYAGPVSLGFSLGRRISRTIHHQVIVYNYTAQTSPRYAWGVKINSVGTLESRVVFTNLFNNCN
jgi:uncharacterized caspase-like protein